MTSVASLPPGYEAVSAGGGQGFALPEASVWLREAVASHATLEAWSRTRPEVEEKTGRGTVHVVPAGAAGPTGAPRWAVRHYLRGGHVASLLGDRYLAVGTPRPHRELTASAAARAAGIHTPAVVAGMVYPAGLFYRAELVTEYVEGGRELAGVLLGEDDGADAGGGRRGAEAPPGGTGTATRVAALRSAGALIARLARARIHHPDLNARNILMVPGADGSRSWLLDLDRCELECTAEGLAGVMAARLLRSLRKLARAKGTEAPAAWGTTLAEGMTAHGEGAP